MRAISFASYGPADVLHSVHIPVPVPGPGQVLVRVAAAAVNPADWRVRRGDLRRFLRLRLPFVPGIDLAGVVEAAGAGVPQEWVGRAVCAMQPAKAGGAYAEYAVVDLDHIAPAPAGHSLLVAAALPLCGLTALQALRRGDLTAGQRLLVHGASGGVGTMAVQLGRVTGAEVTAVTSTRNVDVVTALGAHEVLDYTRQELPRAGDFDVVLDAANHLPWRRAVSLLRPGGTAVSVNPTVGLLAPDWLAWTRGGRRVHSVLVRSNGEDLTWLAERVSSGEVRPVVERTYPLAEATQAHLRSETGRVRGKLVLVVDEALATGPDSAPRQPQDTRA